MNKFFETLSFKQKIISGFAILSTILILGMGYMLVKFTHVANLGTNIVERNQPVSNTANKALKHAQSASNQLHKFVLTDGENGLDDYANTNEQLQQEIQILLRYAADPDLVINKQHLERSSEIIEEINELSAEIVALNQSYEQNHPIVTSASSLLNPPALEYLGLINQIIDTKTTEGFLAEALLLTEIRHSWSQIMSHLRISLATRSLDELVNVSAYLDVNLKQTERLKAMNLDLGLEGIEALERSRDVYMSNLDIVIDKFHTSIWSWDAHIMATRIMPLYDELEANLNDIAKIQLVQTEKAGTGLSTELSSVRYAFIALISIGLAFAFFISVFITRSLHRPLQQLVAATKAVAKGKLDTRIEASGHDEIAQLKNSFNDMVSDLSKSQTALTNALRETKQASESKSQFLSSMSHELRTPLNAILGFTQLLDMDVKKELAAGRPNDDYRNYAEQIMKAGHHLLDLINAVLDLSRIEEGHLNLQPEPVDIHETVSECIGQIKAGLPTKRNITMINLTSEHKARVFVDRLRLRQVLINLMSNAVKYNQENGTVTIENFLTEDNKLRLSVTDTGVGIAKQNIEKLFDPFERLSFSHGSVEGTGIGLTVTQQLMEAMGGSIGVSSTVGKGSTFWIEMPVFKPSTDALPAQSISESNQADSQTEKKPGSNRRVLYIEDNPANAQLVAAALKRDTHFESIIASTAEEGLSIAKEQTPDIILLDINLPGMNGFAALEILRGHEKTRHIPVIAVSASAMNDDLEAGYEAGFDYYLTKPINIDQLYSVIKNY